MISPTGHRGSRTRLLVGLMTAAVVATIPTPAQAAGPEVPGTGASVVSADDLVRPSRPGTASALAAAAPEPVSRYLSAPEALAPYVPQVSCDPVERPGTVRLRELLRTTYGGPVGGITRPCGGARSEHYEGRAYDWMLDASDPEDAAKASDFLTWLIGPDAKGVAAGNARRLGVMYVIWDRRIWGSYNGVWKSYTGASPHTDHIHISLSWDGAMARTSFWTGTTVAGTDYGPCVRQVGVPAPPYRGRNTQPCPTPTPTPTPTPVAVPGAAQSLVGDWDGDGRDEVGLFVDGVVSLRRDDGAAVRYRYGRAGDVAVVGDWDRDGKDSVGVYRNGMWYLRNSASGGAADRAVGFGLAGDRPVVGTWDGRSLGFGVVRKGRWLLRSSVSQGPADVVVDFGRASDRPLVGDWDGDGRDTPGLQRGDLRFALPGLRQVPVAPVGFGRASMQGFAGDFDGDRRDGWGARSGDHFVWRNDVRAGVAQGDVRFGG
ncbi:hypothetical protein [uncultured Pseudokineococcus sp.]|uniref:hypothetical protein n=1 Tax=uncultured Pseudokineococcus sp. TaxID=1642928 RepID=UPI0026378A5C|nr:hypothetical protein [uncultured Pseudokineococcus sp.]